MIIDRQVPSEDDRPELLFNRAFLFAEGWERLIQEKPPQEGKRAPGRDRTEYDARELFIIYNGKKKI